MMPETRSILLGQSSDPHFRNVAHIASLNENIVIDIDEPIDVALSINDRGEHALEVEGRPVQVRSLWCRLKFPLSPIRRNFAPDLEGVVRDEWNGFAAGLSHLYSAVCKSPHLRAAPQSKLYQLRAAGLAGFKIPRTLCGVGKRPAARFLASHPEAVMKAIHSSRLATKDEDVFDILVTTPFTRALLDDASDQEFTACPYLLQERVSTAGEHRIIAFGGQVFAYRLVDRPNVEPLQDRRLMLPRFELTETPHRLQELIARYFTLTGLRYGVFDIVLEHGCDPVFFECNPEGQWHSANNINAEAIGRDFTDWITGQCAQRTPIC